MPWSTSSRRESLPPNWHHIVKKVKRRDKGECQIAGCVTPGTDVDHINRHAGDNLDNLQLLCRKHHAQKSSREGNEAQAELRKLLKHPGDKEFQNRVHPRDAQRPRNIGF